MHFSKAMDMVLFVNRDVGCDCFDLRKEIPQCGSASPGYLSAINERIWFGLLGKGYFK